MTTLYVLVGVPGSGKTTWIGHQSFDWDTTVVVSTDIFVERYAMSVRKTYNEVFEDYMPTAIGLMAELAQLAFVEGKDVVWDQTSTTINTRAKKLRMAPATYTKIAVVFNTPSPEVHAKMLDRPGKVIPTEVIQDMVARFEMPTVEEGFDKVIIARLLGVEL
jgi:predicted kinase